MPDPRQADSNDSALRRDVGVFGAVMMGLGSIVGTGVFVSIGVGAGIAGPSVMLAVLIGAAVATCNALSSAQLAANFPVSGGTYEYGYRLLNPWLGFSAGWMFLLAKSASAATAALGFAGYLLPAAGVDPQRWLVPTAFVAILALTAVVLTGVRRSSIVNIGIVATAIGSLLLFVAFGVREATARAPETMKPFFPTGEASSPARSLLHAGALMFVAFTGYGRIATLGEEVRDPHRTIPRAIIITLIVTTLLYASVAFVAVGLLGAADLSAAADQTAAPLERAARSLEFPLLPLVLVLGATVAMLGVLLNLILGLSRVALAMGRRGDGPKAVAHITTANATPSVAVILCGLVIAALAATGNVRATWSFSAFTVLIYYAITNLAALRLSRTQRRFHPIIAWAGLIACLSLAFWVEWRVWATGLALLAIGILWRIALRSFTRRSTGA